MFWMASSMSYSTSSRRRNFVVNVCLKTHVRVGFVSPCCRLTKMAMQSVRVKLTRSDSSW